MLISFCTFLRIFCINDQICKWKYFCFLFSPKLTCFYFILSLCHCGDLHNNVEYNTREWNICHFLLCRKYSVFVFCLFFVFVIKYGVSSKFCRLLSLVEEVSFYSCFAESFTIRICYLLLNVSFYIHWDNLHFKKYINYVDKFSNKNQPCIPT